MISINLVTVATGRYRELLPQFLDAAEQFFCADFERRFHVFTDVLPAWLPERPGVTCHRIPHEPWPVCTLHRYARICAAADALGTADYLYWMDADMLCVRHVADEIFSHVVAVVHPGYEHARLEHLPYETRLESTACVLSRWRRRYYQNSFAGGRTEKFLKIAAELRDRIALDERSGIVARWHDESHWNRYLAVRPPTLALSADYSCYSDARGDARTATRRILHCVKNERELRTP